MIVKVSRTTTGNIVLVHWLYLIYILSFACVRLVWCVRMYVVPGVHISIVKTGNVFRECVD